MKNFLFDLYGTLIDIRTDEHSDEFWEKIAALLSADGRRVKERYFKLCAKYASSEEKEFDLSAVFCELLKECGSSRGELSFALEFREASLKKLRLFDGAAELLDGLRSRGARTYLLSNAQACFTRYELEKTGLTKKFDGIMLSSEVGFKKPSEKFFTAAFKKFALLPGECVYVGNDLNDDVSGARKVGMRSVYIETEQSGKYAQNIPLDLFAGSHGELADILFDMVEAV